MDRPLPDDVARPARAHLVALLPASEVSDAWHELLADVDYWGDRDLLPVLRLAHQVVLQHERVSPEAAALALVENGVERPEDVALVLDADVDAARAWTRAATATRDDDGRAPTDPDDGRAPTDPDDGAPPAEAAPPRFRGATTSTSTSTVAPPRPDTDHAAEPTAPAVAPTGAPRSEVPPEPAAGAVKIGFDDDEPLPDLDGTGRGGQLARRAAMVVLAVVLVLVLWVLLG